MKRVNLNDIKGKLSKEEMKKVMGGSTDGCFGKSCIPGGNMVCGACRCVGDTCR